jgi:hypothetical protein
VESSCIKWQSAKLYQIVCVSGSRIASEARVRQMREKYLTVKWYREEKKEKVDNDNL